MYVRGMKQLLAALALLLITACSAGKSEPIPVVATPVPVASSSPVATQTFTKTTQGAFDLGTVVYSPDSTIPFQDVAVVFIPPTLLGSYVQVIQVTLPTLGPQADVTSPVTQITQALGPQYGMRVQVPNSTGTGTVSTWVVWNGQQSSVYTAAAPK